MNEELIRSAAWDLAALEKERVRRGMKIIREYVGVSAAILLEVAHEWDERARAYWFSAFGAGGAGEFLAYAIKDPQSVEPLAKTLNDPDYRFRRFAVGALGLIDDPRIPGLLAQAMTDEEPKVRRTAIHGLQQLGDERSFELVKAALNDPSDKVRSKAARAMHWIGGMEVVHILVPMLKDPSDLVVGSAAFSLGFMYARCAVEPLISTLQVGGEYSQSTIVDALGRLEETRAFEVLLDFLRTTKDRAMRASAAIALSRIKSPCLIEALTEMMHDCDFELRKLAIRVLERMGVPDVSESLIEALKDDDSRVARSAAHALASLGDASGYELLMDELRIEPRLVPSRVSYNPDVFQDQDANRFIRASAAKALGKLKDPRAIEPLAQALCDPAVELSAAESLAKLGDSRGLQHLLQMLEHSDIRSRNTIVQAIGNTKDPAAVSALIELFENEDINQIRSTALSALARIGTPEAISAIESVMAAGGPKALDAAGQLAKLGFESGFVHLHMALDSDDDRTRRSALTELEFIDAPRAVDLVLEYLKDESYADRLRKVRVLGKLGDARAQALLRSMLNDPNRRVRVAAEVTLNRLKRDWIDGQPSA